MLQFGPYPPRKVYPAQPLSRTQQWLPQHGRGRCVCNLRSVRVVTKGRLQQPRCLQRILHICSNLCEILAADLSCVERCWVYCLDSFTVGQEQVGALQEVMVGRRAVRRRRVLWCKPPLHNKYMSVSYQRPVVVIVVEERMTSSHLNAHSCQHKRKRQGGLLPTLELDTEHWTLMQVRVLRRQCLY